jgi:hypothetical protein
VTALIIVLLHFLAVAAPALIAVALVVGIISNVGKAA